MENPFEYTILKHVRTRAEIRAAEEIANRTPCEDFENFKPLFQKVQRELEEGTRITRRFEQNAGIKEGEYFILSGQKVYVAKVGEEFITEYDLKDRRLRVIYDIASGVIYVLRSKSDRSIISENREIIHKIGVTGGSVEKRISNAKLDSTFLMAEVEVVATYNPSNINCMKLENIFHKLFDTAKLDIQIKDRFGNSVSPKEWFLVPLFVIDEAVIKIKDGTIGDYIFDIQNAGLTLREER